MIKFTKKNKGLGEEISLYFGWAVDFRANFDEGVGDGGGRSSCVGLLLEEVDHWIGRELRHFYFWEDACVVNVLRCVTMGMFVMMLMLLRLLKLYLLPLLLFLLQLVEMVL